MAKSTPYLFCRYAIYEDDDPLTPDEEGKFWRKLRVNPLHTAHVSQSPMTSTRF
jgi:hypothetical protein